MVPRVAVQPAVSVAAFAVPIAVSGETPEWARSPWNIGQSAGSALCWGRFGPPARSPWLVVLAVLAGAAGRATTGGGTAPAALVPAATAPAVLVPAIAHTAAAAVTTVIKAGLDRAHLDIRTLPGVRNLAGRWRSCRLGG